MRGAGSLSLGCPGLPEARAAHPGWFWLQQGNSERAALQVARPWGLRVEVPKTEFLWGFRGAGGHGDLQWQEGECHLMPPTPPPPPGALCPAEHRQPSPACLGGTHQTPLGWVPPGGFYSATLSSNPVASKGQGGFQVTFSPKKGNPVCTGCQAV